MNTQDKPTKLEGLLDGLADIGRGWVYDQLDGTSFIKDALDGIDKEIAEAKQAISDLVKEALPEEKRNTRGTTQNPNNPNYLTKSATAYNQCLADIKSNLAQRGFIVGGEDE